jgi:hypothetical protein
MRLLFLSFAVTELSDDDRGSADNGRKPPAVRETIPGVDDVQDSDIAAAQNVFKSGSGLSFSAEATCPEKGPGTVPTPRSRSRSLRGESVGLA